MKSRLDVTMVKAQNRRLVFNEVVTHAPTTRAAIAEHTGLSAGTVATILDELGRSGVVREVKARRQSGGPTVGRMPHTVEFLPKAGRILCLDLATRTPTCYLKDLSLANERSNHLPAANGRYEIHLRRLLEMVGEQTARRSRTEGSSPVIGVGVSVPGPYRSADDLVACKRIPELGEIRLGALIGEYFACPVLIDHDVKLALSTEVQLIPDHDHKTILSLYLGEGVGSAISINGTVFGGAHEFAGEIGQMHLAGGDTLESLASWNGFIEEIGLTGALERADDETPILQSIRQRYEAREPALMRQVERTTQIVAEALANVICVLNPHAIIVSGRYSLFGSRFVDDLKAATERLVIDDLKRDLEFLTPRYAEKGSLIGAASMVRSHWLASHFSGARALAPIGVRSDHLRSAT